MRAHATLDLAELERRPIRVEISPAPTLFALAADAVGAHRGAPHGWLESVRAELERGVVAALSPLAVRPGGFIPASVMPRRAPTAKALGEELDRIAELPAQVVLDDISFACGEQPAGPWGVVARNPRRWLPRYATALRRAWKGVERQWSAAAELFDRELSRVGSACVRGAVAELVGGLHPRASVADGSWMLPDPVLRTLRLPERGLTLIPILGGPESAGAGLHEDGTLDWIAHPLADAWRDPRDLERRNAALDALVGQQRARLLRELERPRTIGRLAETLVAVPSAATHHVSAMEASGLIVRERRGRTVVVHRTARGSRLVELYESH